MAIAFFAQALDKFEEFLVKVGAEAPENHKLYSANSRLHVFVKADKLPGQPAADLSIDLPGETDAMTVQGMKFALDAARGNPKA